eukprot:47354-Pelagomonas_calceolata.AAC.2
MLLAFRIVARSDIFKPLFEDQYEEFMNKELELSRTESHQARSQCPSIQQRVCVPRAACLELKHLRGQLECAGHSHSTRTACLELKHLKGQLECAGHSHSTHTACLELKHLRGQLECAGACGTARAAKTDQHGIGAHTSLLPVGSKLCASCQGAGFMLVPPEVAWAPCTHPDAGEVLGDVQIREEVAICCCWLRILVNSFAPPIPGVFSGILPRPLAAFHPFPKHALSILYLRSTSLTSCLLYLLGMQAALQGPYEEEKKKKKKITWNVKYLYDGDCAMCNSLKKVLERQ